MNPETAIVRSPGARRMARHRDRRRKRLRCIMIELRETEIDVLVRRGWLHPDDRANLAAIRRALHVYLDEHLR